MPTDPLPSADPIDAQKTELRRRARARRNAISPAGRIEAARQVAALGLPELPAGPRILGAYYPVRSEFDPLPLLARLAAEGWRLALPVVMGAAPLAFRAWEPGAPLIPGERGILQPASGDAVRPALLLVPLLAFDAQGRRLGYGGGHYDRTLQALRADGGVTAIGLAFDEQEVAQLPSGPHDERLDIILTPSGARRFKDAV
jgi:5-formyltetrahydrofolate cyclo-ligase